MPTSEEALPFASKYNIKILLQHGLFFYGDFEVPGATEAIGSSDQTSEGPPSIGWILHLRRTSGIGFPRGCETRQSHKSTRSPPLLFRKSLAPFGVHAKSIMDPSRLYKNYINEYIKQFKPDLLSYDYYPFLKGEKSPSNSLFFMQLRLVRECAQKAKLPFMNIIQASNFIERDWALPTPEGLRWQAYSTLAYGGRGVSYFLYWGPKAQGGLYQDGKKTLLADAAAALNREMSALSATLMSFDSLYVFHTAPLPPGAFGAPSECPVQITSPGEFVVGVFGKQSKEQAFMIVNRSCSKHVMAKVKALGCGSNV